MALWRNAVGTAVMAVPALVSEPRTFGRLRRQEWGWSALAAVSLALHFAFFMTSIRMTTVAASTALVCLQAAWIALFQSLRGTKYGWRVGVGVLLAFSGVVVITGFDIGSGTEALVGDGLALIGGVLAAAYTLAGSKARATMSTSSYTTLCYGMTSVLLLVMCLLAGEPVWGFDLNGWIGILALGAVLPGPGAFRPEPPADLAGATDGLHPDPAGNPRGRAVGRVVPGPGLAGRHRRWAWWSSLPGCSLWSAARAKRRSQATARAEDAGKGTGQHLTHRSPGSRRLRRGRCCPVAGSIPAASAWDASGESLLGAGRDPGFGADCHRRHPLPCAWRWLPPRRAPRPSQTASPWSRPPFPSAAASSARSSATSSLASAADDATSSRTSSTLAGTSTGPLARTVVGSTGVGVFHGSSMGLDARQAATAGGAGRSDDGDYEPALFLLCGLLHLFQLLADVARLRRWRFLDACNGFGTGSELFGDLVQRPRESWPAQAFGW